MAMWLDLALISLRIFAQASSYAALNSAPQLTPFAKLRHFAAA